MYTGPTGGMTGTIEKMMGLGSTLVYSPTVSANVQVIIAGLINETLGVGTNISLRYSQGTAPAAQANITGTVAGRTQRLFGPTGGAWSTFVINTRITGLPIFANTWYDVSIAYPGGATGCVSIRDVNLTVQETW
jgi:hypothetical protein